MMQVFIDSFIEKCFFAKKKEDLKIKFNFKCILCELSKETGSLNRLPRVEMMFISELDFWEINPIMFVLDFK